MQDRLSKKIAIVTVVMSLLFPFSSFAQSSQTSTSSPCTTCTAPARELEDYINFSQEIFSILSLNTQKLAQGSYFNSIGPRQGGIYSKLSNDYGPSPILQSIVMGTLRNINKRQSEGRAIAEILSIYTRDIIKDGSLGLINGAQPRPILRDFQYLLDIDTTVSTTIFELGTQGKQGATLSKEQRDALIKLLKKNTGTNKLIATADEYTLELDATTSDLLRMLLRINSKIKRALSLSTIEGRSASTQGIKLSISQDFLQSLVKRYDCVRINNYGSSCGGNFKKVKADIADIVKSFIESGPKQSRARIKTASKRLLTRGKLIVGSEKINEQDLADYLQRENDIINARGDGKALTKRTGRGILTGALSSNIPRVVQNDRQTLVDESKEVATFFEDLRITIKNSNDKKSSKNSETGLTNLTKTEKQALQNNISIKQKNISSLLLSEVITQHNTTKIQQLNVVSYDGQEALSKITYRIRVINDLLSNSVKQDLTRVCNLQCSNLGGICG